MHIEPGIVEGSKIVLSYLTAGGVGAYAATAAWKHVKERGAASLVFGAFATTALTLVFFQVFPHFPVGVSEVHLILGSTLFLLFGAAPAAFGLAAGLLLQGVLVAPFDLPQYGMNVTTLLVPLFALQYVAQRAGRVKSGKPARFVRDSTSHGHAHGPWGSWPVTPERQCHGPSL